MKETNQKEEKSQETITSRQDDDYFMQAIKERLKKANLSIDDLTPRLRAEFEKLVVTLAMEKSDDKVDNILIIGNAANKLFKTFLAATESALEIAGHSQCNKHAKGNRDDLAKWLQNPDILDKTAYCCNLRKYRHILIRDLEVFPFDEGTDASDFSDIEKYVRILATTSPDAQQQLPVDIEDLFKIKVVLDTQSKGHLKSGEKTTPQLPSSRSDNRKKCEHYKGIAQLFEVSERRVKDYAKIKGFPIHKKPNGRVYGYLDELLPWYDKYKKNVLARRKERVRKKIKRDESLHFPKRD